VSVAAPNDSDEACLSETVLDLRTTRLVKQKRDSENIVVRAVWRNIRSIV
jgi:hypothetical protein